MSERDPRVNPRTGDVLRLAEGLTVEVGRRTRTCIYFIVLEEICGLPRLIHVVGWRKCAKDAEVIQRAGGDR